MKTLCFWREMLRLPGAVPIFPMNFLTMTISKNQLGEGPGVEPRAQALQKGKRSRRDAWGGRLSGGLSLPACQHPWLNACSCILHSKLINVNTLPTSAFPADAFFVLLILERMPCMLRAALHSCGFARSTDRRKPLRVFCTLCVKPCRRLERS